LNPSFSIGGRNSDGRLAGGEGRVSSGFHAGKCSCFCRVSIRAGITMRWSPLYRKRERRRWNETIKARLKSIIY